VGDVVFFSGDDSRGKTIVSDLSATHAEFIVPESFIGTQPSPQLPQKTVGNKWGPGNRSLEDMF